MTSPADTLRAAGHPIGEVYLTRAEIAARVHELGAALDAELGDREPLLVAPLKSSVVFLADLSRALPSAHGFDTIELAAFGGGGGGVRLTKDLDSSIVDRHVVIVEDVIDTGLTLAYLTRTFAERQPASLSAVTWGAPFTCAVAALTQYRQGLGDSRWPMVVSVAGNVVHAVLGWSLIYGHLGLPALGVPGAGYATAVTELLEVIALGAVVLRDLRAGPRSTYPLRRALGEVCELGVPTGLQFGAEMLAFTTFTAILSSIGAAQIAAHQIAIYVLRASFLPGIAVSEAGSVLIGQALGGKDLPRADRVHRAATRLAVGFMAVCGLVFAATGGRIVRIFSSDAEIVHVARNLLLVAAVFQVLDAAAIVLRASLRAAKDVKVVAVVGIAVAWTCIPGFAFVLGKLLGLGALGGWLGFIAETAIGSCVFYIRWKRGGWRARYV